MAIMPTKQGFSLVELLMAIAVASIIIVVLTMFVARSFTISREQFEQVRITDDARVELERMSDAIRTAQYVDIVAPSGVTDQPTERWIQVGKNFDLTVYTNIDGDPALEKVRYYIEPTSTDLKQDVTEPAGDGTYGTNAITLTLIRTVRNRTVSYTAPLFSYYSFGGGNTYQRYLPNDNNTGLTDCQLNEVARIRMRLIIDVLEQQLPTAVDIATDVTARAYGGGGQPCP